jgi:hypothetical protein
MSEHSFMGVDFSPIEMDDREKLTAFLAKHPQPLTGYTFATLAAWETFFHYEWAFVEPETLLISYVFGPDPHRHLMQPVGLFSAEVAQSLAGRAGDLPYPLKIICVCEDFLSDHVEFCRSFSASEDRNISNYIYKASALAKLPGRKYARKRNLLAQAESLYAWSCQALTPELISSCFSILDSIVEEEEPVLEGMLKWETSALEYTLRHFDSLSQQGLLVSVGGRPVAFSIYEPISPKTVAVHFERALRSHKGLHQVINWETAKAIAAQGYEFINREEDIGDPGLRDAKLSYHPIKLLKSYQLVRTDS